VFPPLISVVGQKLEGSADTRDAPTTFERQIIAIKDEKRKLTYFQYEKDTCPCTLKPNFACDCIPSKKFSENTRKPYKSIPTPRSALTYMLKITTIAKDPTNIM
jgi:hypothetical protein